MSQELLQIRKKKPAADGWIRRFVVAPDRIDEAIALYEGMGFEVKVERPAVSDFEDQCKECSATICERYMVIFTRDRATEGQP